MTKLNFSPLVDSPNQIYIRVVYPNDNTVSLCSDIFHVGTIKVRDLIECLERLHNERGNVRVDRLYFRGVTG